MLKGDCNECLYGNEPEDSDVCIECGIARKNYTPRKEENIMIEYIDRTAALSFPFANGEYDHEHANKHFIYGCETYKEWLESLPAADVKPIVHAHWTNKERYHSTLFGVCSNCGESSVADPYCSNCGAKMDEEISNA